MVEDATMKEEVVVEEYSTIELTDIELEGIVLSNSSMDSAKYSSTCCRG